MSAPNKAPIDGAAAPSAELALDDALGHDQQATARSSEQADAAAAAARPASSSGDAQGQAVAISAAATSSQPPPPASLEDAARAAIWRDAAPVTPSYARAAAVDLRAASSAMLSAWVGPAASLALPSDLMPGMFAPAVVEAYPATARIVDVAVAQQRTCQVMEVGGCCVPNEPGEGGTLVARLV
jgi:hypothetical protein